MGFLQVRFRFSSLQIIYPVGFLYLKVSWGTFVFEAQNDMKSQVKKKKDKPKSRRQVLEAVKSFLELRRS